MPKNETLILFREKDLYVRIFVGSLSLAYFFLNFIQPHPFCRQYIMFRDSSPFYYCIPLTQLFSKLFR